MSIISEKGGEGGGWGGGGRRNDDLCACYLKVIEGQVYLSTPLGTTGLYINSLLLIYFDSHHKTTFKKL